MIIIIIVLVLVIVIVHNNNNNNNSSSNNNNNNNNNNNDDDNDNNDLFNKSTRWLFSVELHYLQLKQITLITQLATVMYMCKSRLKNKDNCLNNY